MGTIDSYLFLMLQQHGMNGLLMFGAVRHRPFIAGASALLMGMTLSVACMAEIPLFHYSGALLRMLGVDLTLHLVLLAFVLRLLVRNVSTTW